MTIGGNVAAVVCAGFWMSLAGCASLPEPAIHVAAVHTSHAFHGCGAPPLGDHCDSRDTTYEALELGMKWRDGRFFVETDLGYTVHETFLEGGPIMFTGKIGYQITGDRND